MRVRAAERRPLHLRGLFQSINFQRSFRSLAFSIQRFGTQPQLDCFILRLPFVGRDARLERSVSDVDTPLG